MARPREFDRDAALQKAIDVFWAKGFAATSTDDLKDAMGIGRQSLYNAFGDKRQLYVEALRTYQRGTTSGHLRRLTDPASPIAGIEALLVGLIDEDDDRRLLGCMGVGSICEFGSTDPELASLREKIAPVLHEHLLARVEEGQRLGEIDSTINAGDAASFVQMTMTGLQTAARAGGSLDDLRKLARFSVDRLKTN
ncbi:TetR/AcrR family transcriptional regulator (plasmid) [Novosphingobium sp. BL-8A]|uniref:TetR/AcrR family transcriptional regulator n=1 Tax=Novosphingobium sp. BL-8A TaxID=3127639 RepID=UPI0037568941